MDLGMLEAPFTNHPLHKWMDGQTEGRMDRWMDVKIDFRTAQSQKLLWILTAKTYFPYHGPPDFMSPSYLTLWNMSFSGYSITPFPFLVEIFASPAENPKHFYLLYLSKNNCCIFCPWFWWCGLQMLVKICFFMYLK